MKLDPAVFVLRPSERLTGVTKEPYTKRRHGKAFGYIVADRTGRLSFFGQKLPLLCKVINEKLGEHDPASKVSLNGLWQTVDRVEGRAGPFCKNRWSVRRVDLDEACEEYAREGRWHERVFVCADELNCYRVGEVAPAMA